MFNQIITAFQGFFSRAFWFGSFLPVAVTGTLHLTICHFAFPGLLPTAEWLDAGFSDTAATFVLTIVALVVVAYALTPFPPLIRGFLEGRIMPDWLHDLLRRDRMSAWRRADAKFVKAKNDASEFRRLDVHGIPRIWKAARIGNEIEAIQQPRLIDEAQKIVETWRDEVKHGGLPARSLANDAVDALVSAMETNTSVFPGDADHTDAARAAALTATKEALIDLLKAANDEASYRFARASSRYYRLDLHPTRVGEARWLAERHSQDTYHVGFDYVWPRVQLVLKKEDNADFMERLNDTRSQVDFAALALGLSLTIPLTWLPTILVAGGSPWLFLTIGMLSPAVLIFLFELLVQSQLVFGDVVRVAIDRYRLEVLTEMLRQPAPATLTVERDLWCRLMAASEPGNRQDLSYRHPKS